MYLDIDSIVLSHSDSTDSRFLGGFKNEIGSPRIF